MNSAQMPEVRGFSRVPLERKNIAKKSQKDWERFSFDLPSAMATRMRDLAREDVRNRGGAMKLSGTGAIALWLGLPQPIRMAIVEWVAKVEARPELANTPQEAAVIFTTMIRSMIAARDEEEAAGVPHPPSTTDPQWFIDRILDPVVTAGHASHAGKSNQQHRQSKVG